MKSTTMSRLFAGLFALALAVSLSGCKGAAESGSVDSTQPSVAQTSSEAGQEITESQTGNNDQAGQGNCPGGEGQSGQVLANGTYDIDVETDSSMFRSESCTLTVEDGTYTATLSLPGEGFSRLYFGTAEEAAQASDDKIYEYHLNDEGKYTFDLPVEALDKELTIAAYGQRRDTWYDHTIIFYTPDAA